MLFKEDIFKEKTILVTGGGSGIGKEIARQYLELGAQVYITGRKEEKLIKAHEELSNLGDCIYKVCDIRDVDQIADLSDDIKNKIT